ncbi:GNAT family N-acetyltransferase [Alkalihalobacillus trypoxylicola]|uniref:BioF2-like acetyltransferase domain-containing protein n=1 Tax=Alkalihalobacillus trypoxylicola TaxID=519424 RepID=A0A161Q917_9BACI|nr:GNAT family N-acetyltransferase [Alkalihalobacillus trypoxylicola]KYG33711.1 hypothetical protein AZF04_15920 [Alkalihalobacillus trypoxylicola]
MIKNKIAEELEDDALNEFVSKYGLVQHSPKLKTIFEGFNSYLYKYVACYNGQEVVGILPFIHYKNDLGDVVHSLPYLGYGGGCTIDDDNEILSSMLLTLMEYCQQKQILLLTICTPPFSKQLNVYTETLQPDYIKDNFYQYIPLRSDFLTLMNSKNRNNLKRNLKHAESTGIYLNQDNSEEMLKVWYETIYKPRLETTGGAIYPFEVFNHLRHFFGGDRVVVQYAMLDDTIVGASILLKQNKSLDNFMRVVGNDYMHTQAGVMLDYWSIQYAQSQGYEYYNWQSCDRVDSPIFKYKENWGSKVDKHFYITKTINSIEEFKRSSLDEIIENYKGIYVLPYSEFKKKG